MKKNQGFIATSLLSSFFLVFIAMLLALVSTLLHNRVLLNNVITSIKEELSETGTRTLGLAEVGSYVDIPVFSTGITVNTENIKWIIASHNTTNKTVTMVSDQIVITSKSHQNNNVLQEDLNRYFNLYTTGTGALNYMTYLTNTQINSFQSVSNIQTRKALLSAESEYYYYNTSDGYFYLYQYTCNIDDVCNVAKNQRITTGNTTYYGLRFVMIVSSSTPISSGIGVINDPYNTSYYIHKKESENILKLHYDNINHNGNLGFKTSANNITDLSGNNLNGSINTGNYTNNSGSGATIPASRLINSNLNIHQIINSPAGYTLEFRVLNNIRLAASPTYLNNFVLLTNNATLKLYNSNFATGVSSGSFNTITIVKTPGEALLSVYINGEKISATITVSNLPAAANNILYVGGSTNSEIFKSIRVYNAALTEQEIIHNYSVDSRWSL